MTHSICCLDIFLRVELLVIADARHCVDRLLLKRNDRHSPSEILQDIDAIACNEIQIEIV